jgi:dihydropteroate synthase
MQFGSTTLDLRRPHVMGILNVTPDSFSDGGELLEYGTPVLARVIDRAAAMVTAGASFLDVGGESTRPGAAAVGQQEEMDRVLPVLLALNQRFDTVLSVDTSNATLMTAAASAGAGLINDVRALSQPGALEAANLTGLPVCLMHMQGEPSTMQAAPGYRDVVVEVVEFLEQRIQVCLAAGIASSRLVLDPGFGFGKSLQHNLVLLAQLGKLQTLGLPVLVGLSRKRMLGMLTGKTEQQRESAGIAASVLALQHGARIIRTHDVSSTVDAVKVWSAVHSASEA